MAKKIIVSPGDKFGMLTIVHEVDCDANGNREFLCKCDLFTERYQVPQFTGMFVEE